MSTVPQLNIPTSIALTVAEWFGSQSPRMRRTKFEKAWMLADELFLIFSRVPDTTSGPITVHSSDLTVAALDLPPIEAINIPPIDLEAIEIPVPEPYTDHSESEFGETEVSKVQEKWYRLSCLAQVTDGEGDTYELDLYPNGPDQPTLHIFEATVPQISEDATIPKETYVNAHRGQFLRIKTIKTYNKDGVEIATRTEISQLETFCWFQPPIWIPQGE